MLIRLASSRCGRALFLSAVVLGASVSSAGVPWRQAQIAHAAGTCAPVASPTADVAPSGTFDTVANIVATFDAARAQEGCTTPLSIDSMYSTATPQQQMLMLFNAERRDRGLSTLQLDSTLLSQIDLNHSAEMAKYAYFNHPSPVNQPGPSNVFKRLTVNPAINGHWTGLAENIAAGYSTAAAAVYAYMYQDSGSAWGHRHNILGYSGSTFGAYNWAGVGVAKGGSYGVYYSSDFMQSSSVAPYTPPASTDTQAPSLSAPTITSGAAGGTETAQVTKVQDSGAATGAAGVTGVVFYANSITVDSSGNANTVVATQSGTTWTATLSLPAGATLHAVAVDGSGNLTDCAQGATTCGSAVAPTPTPISTPTSTSTPAPMVWMLHGRPSGGRHGRRHTAVRHCGPRGGSVDQDSCPGSA